MFRTKAGGLLTDNPTLEEEKVTPGRGGVGDKGEDRIKLTERREEKRRDGKREAQKSESEKAVIDFRSLGAFLVLGVNGMHRGVIMKKEIESESEREVVCRGCSGNQRSVVVIVD